MITLTDTLIAQAAIAPDRITAVQALYVAVKDLIAPADHAVIEETFRNITDPPTETDQ